MEGSSSRLKIRGRIWRYNSTRQGKPGPYTEVDVHRLASKFYRARKRSEGAKADWKAAINIDEAEEGRIREMDDSERLIDSMGESEGRRYRIISKLQVFQRAEKNFNRRMEYLGVWGYEGGRSVTSNIDGGGIQGEAG